MSFGPRHRFRNETMSLPPQWLSLLLSQQQRSMRDAFNSLDSATHASVFLQFLSRLPEGDLTFNRADDVSREMCNLFKEALNHALVQAGRSERANIQRRKLAQLLVDFGAPVPAAAEVHNPSFLQGSIFPLLNPTQLTRATALLQWVQGHAADAVPTPPAIRALYEDIDDLEDELDRAHEALSDLRNGSITREHELTLAMIRITELSSANAELVERITDLERAVSRKSARHE